MNEITGKYGPQKTPYSDTSRSEQLTKNEHHNKHFNVFFSKKKKEINNNTRGLLV